MRHTLWMIPTLLALVAIGPAVAQTPDGETPANEGICDVLLGGTPGLYGLCVGFCEANDCDPDYGAADPFALCKPSDTRLLDAYNRLKQPADPEMPCYITDTDCPCFTQEMVDAIPTPYSQCIIDYDFGTGGTGDNTNIIYVQGTGAQATLGLFPSCVYGNGLVDPPEFVYFPTNTAQAETCRQYLVNTIESNIGECQLLCDPTCH